VKESINYKPLLAFGLARLSLPSHCSPFFLLKAMISACNIEVYQASPCSKYRKAAIILLFALFGALSLGGRVVVFAEFVMEVVAWNELG
jgi:hypothetical protein